MLVKAQVTSLSVFICDSLTFLCIMLLLCLWFATFHPAGEEPRWSGEGRDVNVRFCIAIDLSLQSREMVWLQYWKGGTTGSWATLSFSLLLYHTGQLCLPCGLYHVFPCECLPLARHALLHLISALTQDGICCDMQLDGISEGVLWLPEQSSLKHPAATSVQCIAQGCSCQMTWVQWAFLWEIWVKAKGARLCM